MRRILLASCTLVIAFVLASIPSSVFVSGLAQSSQKSRKEALQRLSAASGGRIRLKQSRATGTMNFASLDRNVPGSLVGGAGSAREKSARFLRDYGAVFGVSDSTSELRETSEKRDDVGMTHFTYQQVYRGVPVFGAVFKTHVNSNGELRVANGTLVPDLNLSVVAGITAQSATSIATAEVRRTKSTSGSLKSDGATLFVYRKGLDRGVPDKDYLVWKVNVTDGVRVSEAVFVNAASGAVVDRFSLRMDAMTRYLFDGHGTGQSFDLFWAEGQAFPTGNAVADQILNGTKETYNLFRTAFGMDSFDNQGSPMVSLFNFGMTQNAFASPVDGYTGFGDTFAIDDVVGHEWTHLYTYHTHGLIYRYQPGALNEAYSDIFGETLDLINNRGLDQPDARRSPAGGQCSSFSTPQPVLRINSPSAIAGDYFASRGTEGPSVPPEGPTAAVAVGSGAQVAGKIALVDVVPGVFDWNERIRSASSSGAVAAILVLPILGIPPGFYLGDATLPIQSVLVNSTVGDLLKAQLASGVTPNVSLIVGGNLDISRRWLIGEEDSYAGEAFRDMWRPECYGNPGVMSEFWCELNFDSGGVHENSGIPGHAFALLVDGGTYGGRTVQGIGLTKAAHIYFRAMSEYQVPTTDFADHAAALEAAAADLIGHPLRDLLTGRRNGEALTALDAEQVHEAILAVGLLEDPSHCGFQPLLAKNTPADSCDEIAAPKQTIFFDDFETNPLPWWSVSREVASATTFIPRDWRWVGDLPERTGAGFFAPDPIAYGACSLQNPGQIGVLELMSPNIPIPPTVTGSPHLSFDHWVALEDRYDGGQLMISVNGGPFQLVPSAAFIFNGYNQTLFPSVPGFEHFFNPRAGQPAFTGTDAASVKGSWGTSLVDLSSFAHAGDVVRLRWDMSTDFCFGTDSGWYLDNVRLYACSSQPLTVSECKNGLWERFTIPRAFKSQGDCEQFVKIRR